MVKALILETSGNIKEVKIRFTKRSKVSTLKKYVDKNIDENIELLTTWNIDDFDLIAYGFKSGNEEDINQHELLPSSNECKYYYNILLVKCKDNIYIDITIEEYTKYYNEFYGYISDEGSCDEIIDDDNDDDESVNYENSLDGDSIDDIDDIDESEMFLIIDEKHQEIEENMNKSLGSIELDYESYSSESDFD